MSTAADRAWDLHEAWAMIVRARKRYGMDEENVTVATEWFLDDEMDTSLELHTRDFKDWWISIEREEETLVEILLSRGEEKKELKDIAAMFRQMAETIEAVEEILRGER